MEWVLNKVAGLFLISLPIITGVLLWKFDYGTHWILEVMGLLIVSSIWILISLVCFWAGGLLMKMTSEK